VTVAAAEGIERLRLGKSWSVPEPKGVVMSVLRTRDRDDVVVDRTEGRDATTVSGSTKTTQRFWTFAPGQVVSLIVGVGFVIVGVLALVRAGLDGSLATPVVEVLGYTHTAWLGVAEIGLGLLLVLAGTGAWGRPLSVLLGAAMAIAGVLVIAETSQMPEELGLEEAYGWPLVILGALVALAALALPVWRTQRHDRDAVDLRDGDREVVRH
jgi:hypothetical protein